MNPENDSTMTGRPLEGKAIGISVALGEDHARCGYGAEEMNRTVVRLSEVLLSAGARLVFGHDWRPYGIDDHGFGHLGLSPGSVGRRRRKMAGRGRKS